VADTTVGFDFEVYANAGETRGVAPDSERVLVEGLRAAEEKAYETLIEQFEHPVFNVVSRLMEDPSDAADVVQEVFLKVFRNVATFRGDSSLKTWIYRIAVNEARNHRRWFSRHKGREVGLEAESDETQSYGECLPDPGRSPFETAMNHETQALIEEALANVSPNFRAALVLREIEGLSYDEISEILAISLGTVKSRILRGREALRKNLASRLEPAAGLEWTPQLAD
jgi:RNA polymerase sigma-70 factor (ECF subfamily)